MSCLWISDDAAKATRGKSLNNWSATGISIDSRSVEPGDLFMAISGPNFDGHDFVLSALKKGASAAIISHDIDGFAPEMPLLNVKDTFEALNDLGRAGRNRSEAVVIAVTGSVGKTGVKEALGQLLSSQGKTSYSRGSFNNHLGVPLSLARLPKDADYAVFELGMNHAGELTQLSRIARPSVAIVTNVEATHVEFFSTIDDIAHAKAEIFQGLEEGGTAILNRDNKYFDLLAAAATAAGAKSVIGFGLHDEAQFKLIDFALSSRGSTVEAEFDDGLLTYRLSMPGRHWVQNSLAVLAAVQAVGADVFAAAQSFTNIKPLKGRGQRYILPIKGGQFELIDDSYNASPVSIAAALKVLAGSVVGPSGRRICALGDMRELGNSSADFHRALAPHVRTANVDLVYAAGPGMKHMCGELPDTIGIVHTDKSVELVELLQDEIQPGDVVLVKGSAGSQMNKLVEAFLDFQQGSKEAKHAI